MLTRVFLCCLLLWSVTSAERYSVPAEWRVDQDATWMAWPLFEFTPDQSPIPIVLDMMAYITKSEDVYLIIVDAEQESEAREAIKEYNKQSSQTINTNNVIYKQVDHTDFWMRDYLLFAQDQKGRLVVIDFDFNEWGYGSVSEYFDISSTVDTTIPNQIGSVLGVPVIRSSLSVEGGGLEFNDAQSNGKRKLIVSEALVLQQERNPGLTKQQAHDELLRVFNLDEIIWLPKFRYDSTNNREIVVPQCPVSNSGQQLGEAYCHDATSDYYVVAAGGGIVEDDSTFSGPHLNPETLSARAANGHSDAKYDYVLNPITTNGHTDEMVRWIGENRVLLAQEPGTHDSSSIEGRSQFRLETIRNILENAGIEVVRITTAATKVNYFSNGTTWESILDMQFTSGEAEINGIVTDLTDTAILDLFEEDQEIPFLTARSYLNFIITNDHVLVPIYGDDRDQDALNVIQNAFGKSSKNHTGRTRTVIPIKNLDYVNSGGGGMHCITQNQPSDIARNTYSNQDNSSSNAGNLLTVSGFLLVVCLVVILGC